AIERRYRRYRTQQVAHSHMETYLRTVMVEHTCPDCQGTRLKRQRLLVTVGGLSIHQMGALSLRDLRAMLAGVPATAQARGGQAGEQIVAELLARLDLLVGVGLDYLSLNRGA